MESIKNYKNFKKNEKTKASMLERVEQIIGFVKQTNDVIREYNQKVAKNSYVLKSKL